LDTLKLSVPAVGYDATIARDDRLDPAVREATVEARRRGVKVMPVTGRIRDDLQHVACESVFGPPFHDRFGEVAHGPGRVPPQETAPDLQP
jgi:hypothetical protein